MQIRKTLPHNSLIYKNVLAQIMWHSQIYKTTFSNRFCKLTKFIDILCIKIKFTRLTHMFVKYVYIFLHFHYPEPVKAFSAFVLAYLMTVHTLMIWHKAGDVECNLRSYNLVHDGQSSLSQSINMNRL
jgi:hypothetical protein